MESRKERPTAARAGPTAMQFSVRRLFFLTAVVACMFSIVGRYWPLGTAVAVVVSVATGIVMLAFGTLKSWKLVVWTCAVFLGSLVSIRYALHLGDLWNEMKDWPDYVVEAIALLGGAVLSGTVAAVLLVLVDRRPARGRLGNVDGGEDCGEP